MSYNLEIKALRSVHHCAKTTALISRRSPFRHLSIFTKSENVRRSQFGSCGNRRNNSGTCNSFGRKSVTSIEYVTRSQVSSEEEHFPMMTRLEDAKLGDSVCVHGWIERGAKLGKSLCFFRLLSNDGRTVQLVWKPFRAQSTDEPDGLKQKLGSVSDGSVVTVQGILQKRHGPGEWLYSPSTSNSHHSFSGNNSASTNKGTTASSTLSWWEYEIEINDIEILNGTTPLPFNPWRALEVDESLRMRNRHIDLRNPLNLQPILLRSRILQHIRSTLLDKPFLNRNFHEVETPLLFAHTPEGAREFIVPSRKYPGEGYSLVQSPQQWKQILMVSSLGNYMQVARCFRDEDGRKDRQLEFTQLDIEMSFVRQLDVIQVIERLISSIWSKFLPQSSFSQQLANDISNTSSSLTIKRLDYEDVMIKYGIDKPDLRIPLEIHTIRSTDTASSNELLQAMNVNSAGRISSDVLKRIYDECAAEDSSMQFAVAGKDGTIEHVYGMQRDLSSENLPFTAAEGDLIVTAVIPAIPRGGSTEIGRSRLALYSALQASGIAPQFDENRHEFLWIVNFPLFTPAQEEVDVMQKSAVNLVSTHHPFTAPHESDISLLHSAPKCVRGQHYDLVLNGVELGGGSIRIHRADLQRRILKDVMRLSSDQQKSFEHLIRILAAGAPPHGGFAIGLDRMIAMICNRKSIRDVIAFPKTAGGRDTMVNSPRKISSESLAELGLATAQNIPQVSNEI